MPSRRIAPGSATMVIRNNCRVCSVVSTRVEIFRWMEASLRAFGDKLLILHQPLHRVEEEVSIAQQGQPGIAGKITVSIDNQTGAGFRLAESPPAEWRVPVRWPVLAKRCRHCQGNRPRPGFRAFKVYRAFGGVGSGAKARPGSRSGAAERLGREYAARQGVGRLNRTGEGKDGADLEVCDNLDSRYYTATPAGSARHRQRACSADHRPHPGRARTPYWARKAVRFGCRQGIEHEEETPAGREIAAQTFQAHPVRSRSAGR